MCVGSYLVGCLQKIELLVIYTRSQIRVKVVKERGNHRVDLCRSITCRRYGDCPV